MKEMVRGGALGAIGTVFLPGACDWLGAIGVNPEMCAEKSRPACPAAPALRRLTTWWSCRVRATSS